MTTKQTRSKQEAVDTIVKALGVFVALAFVWATSGLLSQVVNPLGLFSLVATLAFLSTVVALSYVVVSAGTLYLKLS